MYLPQRFAGAEAPRRSDPPVALDGPEPARPPPDADFSGRTVLLVDDDMRNLFAINSVLEAAKMKVVHAQNGKEALTMLQQHPDVELVLMDTMMPEMDGLAAIQAIRRMPLFETLPILSLTAKVMKGDREDAIAAGASDYVAKPVDPDRLLAVMHRWLNGPAADGAGPASGSA
jgi:CheY-like chemotaxis protein